MMGMMKKLLSFLIAVLLVSAASAEPAFVPRIGSTVMFGCYEQDNNYDNGPEPIEWVVLDVQDGKALLLSKYGLDARAFHIVREKVTWDTCTLRTWLNQDFYQSVFSPEEQSAILLTEVDNSIAQGYETWSSEYGSDTQDYIFLLSYAEAKKYIDPNIENDNNMRIQLVPTEYALSQGALTSKNTMITNGKGDGKIGGFWWLRSPGASMTLTKYSALGVSYAGRLVNCKATSDNGCVRPAFWLDLNAYSP